MIWQDSLTFLVKNVKEPSEKAFIESQFGNFPLIWKFCERNLNIRISQLHEWYLTMPMNQHIKRYWWFLLILISDYYYIFFTLCDTKLVKKNSKNQQNFFHHISYHQKRLLLSELAISICYLLFDFVFIYDLCFYIW